MMVSRVLPAHGRELDRWIAERHYLRSAPAGARLRLWVLDEAGNEIGAMMWGRPTARALDQDSILELTRMVLIDEAGKNSESRALGLARSHIRKHLPAVRGLLAYSSTGQEHEGTIYQADNWFPLGMTQSRAAKTGWTSRDGRELLDGSRKLRWVRTP